MPARDLILFAVFIVSIVVCLKKPIYGVLIVTLFNYLNPHRLTWGPAFNFRFIFYLTAATMVGWFFSKNEKKILLSREVILILAFWSVASFGGFFALNPSGFLEEWERFTKILVTVFLTTSLIREKKHLKYLYWIIIFSVGFYDVKGFFWSLVADSGWVFGPENSFFSGNNGLGLAINMVWPMFYYAAMSEENRYIKTLLWIPFVCSPLTIIRTDSRGSALAMGVTCICFLIRSEKRFKLIMVLILACIIAFPLIPDEWIQRMDTIKNFQEDGSAMGRINSWYAAINMAIDRPLTGGGLRAFTPETISRYAPNPENYHDVHSIYFEIIGETGFPGFILFISLILFTILSLLKISREAKTEPNQKFYKNFADGTLLGIIGYLANGVFVGMAYFDLFYQYIGCLVIMKMLIKKEKENKNEFENGINDEKQAYIDQNMC